MVAAQFRVALIECLARLLHRKTQLVTHLKRTRLRRTIWKINADLNEVILDLRHEAERHDVRLHKHDCEHEERSENRNRNVAKFHRVFEQRLVDPVGKRDQAVSYRLLKAHQLAERTVKLLRLHMAEVRWQDEHRLDERECQRRNNDIGDLRSELAFRAGDECPRRKHDHRGKNAEDNRLEHELRADSRSAQPFSSSALDLLVDILANDNRVVDHHADHEQDCEERKEVQRHAEKRQDHDAAGKGSTDTDRHPERHDRAQEEDQDDKNERHTLHGCRADRVHAAFIDLRHVEQQVELQAFRQSILSAAAIGAFDEVLDVVGVEDDVHLLWLVHHDEGGRFAIEGGVQLTINETIDDVCNVADADRAELCALANDDILEVFTRISELTGLDRHSAGFGADSAAGGVDRGAANRIGDFGKGHVVAAQRGF